jgi:putative FmdB family regulatory protein
MPIYEYLCREGHLFDRVQRFADEPLKVCEVCGKPAQRVLHAPAVHFKGKGFYATDYGRKGANGAKPESGSESGSKEAATSSGGGSEGGSGSSESKSSESKSSESKSGDSKGSGGESSSRKSDQKSSTA